MKKYLYILLVFGLLSCTANQSKGEVTSEDKEWRIVSLSGTTTEILAHFGYLDQIIGVDVTSTFPNEVNTIPKVGHTRSISIEGIMAMNPNLIVGKIDGTSQSLTHEQIQRLKETGIKTLVYKQEYSVEGTYNLIDSLAKDLKVDYKKVDKLKEEIESQLAGIHPPKEPQTVLFIYARTGMMMVSGVNTSVNEMIEIAGAKNAIQEFEGFKPLTTESLVKANPDVILMFDHGMESLNGEEGVLLTPGVLQTKAGKNKKIFSMDGLYLSGFGPRLGNAALELHHKIYQ